MKKEILTLAAVVLGIGTLVVAHHDLQTDAVVDDTVTTDFTTQQNVVHMNVRVSDASGVIFSGDLNDVGGDIIHADGSVLSESAMTATLPESTGRSLDVSVITAVDLSSTITVTFFDLNGDTLSVLNTTKDFTTQIEGDVEGFPVPDEAVSVQVSLSRDSWPQLFK